jgi:hypothetical protein
MVLGKILTDIVGNNLVALAELVLHQPGGTENPAKQ